MNADDNVKCGKFKFALNDVATRVVVIPENITLDDVHRVVQSLFGWDNCHLWEFEDKEGRRFGYRDENESFPSESALIDPSKVCLSDVLPSRGDKLKYTYDFGDCWEHTITRMVDPKVLGCYCVKTNGPDGMEDCGGIWGMQEGGSDWNIPCVDEITTRLKSLSLSALARKTGFIDREKRNLDRRICELTEQEWCWILKFAREGFVSIRCASTRLESLFATMPGVRKIGMMGYSADPEFRRYWRREGERLAAMWAGAES